MPSEEIKAKLLEHINVHAQVMNDTEGVIKQVFSEAQERIKTLLDEYENRAKLVAAFVQPSSVPGRITPTGESYINGIHSEHFAALDKIQRVGEELLEVFMTGSSLVHTAKSQHE